MGICISSCTDTVHVVDHKMPSANVLSIGGELRQYPLPITVSQVLLLEFANSSSSSSSSSAFLCNSDSLYFNDYIPALSPDDELHGDQIYFVLPVSKLQYRLSSSDMAALAVKASLALESHNNSSARKKNKARISPVIVELEQQSEQQESNRKLNNKAYCYYADSNNNNNNEHHQSKKKQEQRHSSSSGLGVSRSKLQRRYSSRRAKLAVRSFKMRLTTIYEGSILAFN